jgi:hypothetical protein
MSARTVVRFVSLVLAVGFASFACGDSSTPFEPASGIPPRLDLEVYSDSFQVHGLKRIGRVSRVTVRTTIDPLKSRYVPIPSAGFALWIPRGALARKTDITITVRPGRHIAYEFEPHGLVFREPLIGIQSLRGTRVETDAAGARRLRAAYFATDSLELDPVTGTATVVEFERATVDFRTKQFYFAIPHFSGYMVAVGARDEREY